MSCREIYLPPEVRVRVMDFVDKASALEEQINKVYKEMWEFIGEETNGATNVSIWKLYEEAGLLLRMDPEDIEYYESIGRDYLSGFNGEFDF